MTSAKQREVINVDRDMESIYNDTAMDVDEADGGRKIGTKDDVEYDDPDTPISPHSESEAIHQTIEGSEGSVDGSSEEGSPTKTGYTVSKRLKYRMRNNSGRLVYLYNKQPKPRRPRPLTHRPRDAYRKLLNDYIRSVTNPTEATGADEDIERQLKWETDSLGRPVSARIGAILWSTVEQDQLFSALSRYGLHDLPAIARTVTTKSMPEILNYLVEIRTSTKHHELKGRRDRLWEGAAAIPAAFEIGEGCEKALEKGADNLMKREERHNKDCLQESWGAWGILDWAGATELSQDVDYDERIIKTRLRRKTKRRQRNMEEDNSRDSTPTPYSADEDNDATVQQSFKFLEPVHPSASPFDRLQPVVNLFDLPKFLDLSARIFMNPHVPQSPEYPSVNHHNSDRNWYTMQTKKSRALPSITAPCALDFLNLAVIFTKRLMSTALHIANSRSRATDVLVEYRGSPSVSENDVITACKVLKTKTRQDRREWWKSVPRRNGLRVVDTTGEQPLRRGRKGIISIVGERAGSRLGYTEVEKRLEVNEDDRTDDEDVKADENVNDEGELSDANEAESSDQFFSLTSNEDGDVSDTDAPSVTWTSSSPSASPPGPSRVQSDEYGRTSSERSAASPPLPPEIIAELEAGELETAHLDYIDAVATKAEEARLYALLKLPPPASKDGDIDDDIRPKPPKLPPRKRKEPKDLVAWYDNLLPPNPAPIRRVNQRFSAVSSPGGEYISEWQAYCGHVPASAFARTREEWNNSRKRKRLEEKKVLQKQRQKRQRTVVGIGARVDEGDGSGSDDSRTDMSSDSRDSEVDEDERESVDEREDITEREDDKDDDLILDADEADDDANDLDDLLIQQSESSEDSDDEDDGATTTSQGTDVDEQSEHTSSQHAPTLAPIPAQTTSAPLPPSPLEAAAHPRRSTRNTAPRAELHTEQVMAIAPNDETSDSSTPALARRASTQLRPSQAASPPSQAIPQPSSRPRRSAAPSNLQVNVQPADDGEEGAAWPAYLARRLGGIAEGDEQDSGSEGEWSDASMEDE